MAPCNDPTIRKNRSRVICKALRDAELVVEERSDLGVEPVGVRIALVVP